MIRVPGSGFPALPWSSPCEASELNPVVLNLIRVWGVSVAADLEG